MKEIMSFETCMEHIRKVEPDLKKANATVKIADARLKLILHAEKDNETASIIVEGYYEVIKELLTALLLKQGFKSDNHECLISYFREKYPKYQYEVQKMHELKNIRNKINYEGIFVKPIYLMQNELEFKHIIELLKQLVEQQTI